MSNHDDTSSMGYMNLDQDDSSKDNLKTEQDDTSSLGYLNLEHDDNNPLDDTFFKHMDLAKKLAIIKKQESIEDISPFLDTHLPYKAERDDLLNEDKTKIDETLNKYKQMEETLQDVLKQNRENSNKIDYLTSKLESSNDKQEHDDKLEKDKFEQMEEALQDMIKQNRENSLKIDHLTSKLELKSEQLEELTDTSENKFSKEHSSPDNEDLSKDTDNQDDDLSEDTDNQDLLEQPIIKPSNLTKQEDLSKDNQDEDLSDKNIDENLTLDISENPVKQTGGSNKVKRSRKVSKKLNKQKNKQSGGQNKLKIDRDVSNFVDTIFSIFSKSK